LHCGHLVEDFRASPVAGDVFARSPHNLFSRPEAKIAESANKIRVVHQRRAGAA